MGERWTEDCVLALQRRISNRILRIEIQGVHEGKALVAMIDEASDPQANIAELLCSAGFSVPAVVATRTEQQTDQEATATAELQGGSASKMDLNIRVRYSIIRQYLFLLYWLTTLIYLLKISRILAMINEQKCIFCVKICTSAPTPAWEPLLWSCAELPCDGQTVALLASVVESPQKFYCHIDNPAGNVGPRLLVR